MYFCSVLSSIFVFVFIGQFFRQFWTLLDTLDTFGHFRTLLDSFGQFWTVLDSFGQYGHFGHFRVGRKLFNARIFCLVSGLCIFVLYFYVSLYLYFLDSSLDSFKYFWTLLDNLDTFGQFGTVLDTLHIVGSVTIVQC